MPRHQVIELGGQRFTPLTVSTVLHDEWFIVQRRRAGLERVEVQPGERPEDFAQRVHDDVVTSGRMRLLIAGLIVPVGVQRWSPRVAKRTARHIGNLHSEEDKRVVRQLTLSLLIDFFETGLSSLWTSGSASADAAEQPLLSPDVAPGAISDPASGIHSSERSPDTITTGLAG